MFRLCFRETAGKRMLIKANNAAAPLSDANTAMHKDN